MQTEGKQVDVRGVTQGFDEGIDMPQAAALVEFAEAVVLNDAPRIAVARATLLPALGGAGLVDAAAIVAAFHGFVRIADAIGIPDFTPAGGQDLAGLREQAGINEFYRKRENLRA